MVCDLCYFDKNIEGDIPAACDDAVKGALVNLEEVGELSAREVMVCHVSYADHGEPVPNGLLFFEKSVVIGAHGYSFLWRRFKKRCLASSISSF